MSGERFDRIDATLKTVTTGLSNVTTRLSKVATDVGTLTTDVSTLTTDVSKLTVLHEETRDQVKLFAEGLDATNERIDRFEQRVDFRFDRLEGTMRALFQHHDNRITALEARSHRSTGPA